LGNLSLLVFIKELAQEKHSSGHGSPSKPRQSAFYINEQNNGCAKLKDAHERIKLLVLMKMKVIEHQKYLLLSRVNNKQQLI